MPNWGNPATAQGQGWHSPAATNSNEPLVTPAPAPSDEQQAQKDAPSQEPAVTADGDKRSRQLDILQAIERGEISVDEGMRRLGEIEA
jgi:hypothetical protein